MAILRTTLIGDGTVIQNREDGILRSRTCGVYDGIVESASDLSLSRAEDFAPGSLMLCLEDQKLYIKNGKSLWQEVTV